MISDMTEERLHIDWGIDKLYRTQRQVEKNPYDLESWSILLREAQSKHISEVRPLYEHLISIFPSASRYWRIYIEHEVQIDVV
ncbi:rna cleavage stimulation factor [Holotrichia oblita]|uniref:Rna cleavage stimulation factor n=1 Tax=Holotrichia oblita TaxID=644536 RepID=A0ACB9SJJ4_HOLOL|nr:rna cleavage stimulation factor [Holotrichia oblita]